MKKIIENKYQIITIFLFVTMCCQIGIQKLLAWAVPIFNLPYDHPVMDVAYFLMEVSALFLCIYSSSKWNEFFKQHKAFSIEMALMGVCIITTAVISYTRYRLRPTNILTHELEFIFLFWAVLLYVLLTEGKMSLDKFLNLTFMFTTIGMLILTFAHFYTDTTGLHIYCLDAGYDWNDKNGTQRFAPVSMMLLLLPCAVYEFRKEKELLKRLAYVAYAAYVIWYIVYIYQARTVILIVGLILIFCWLVYSKSLLTFGIKVLLLIIGAYAAWKTTIPFLIVYNELFSGFNTSGTQHLEEYKYFINEYLAHPIFGLGFFDENMIAHADYLLYNLYISDCGNFASWFIAGIPMILLCVVILLRGFILGIKGTLEGNENSKFLLILTGMMALIGLVMNWFDPNYSLQTAIYLGIAEFLIASKKHNKGF